jgi:hypothetical protein
MLFKETTADYTEKNKKPTNALSGKNNCLNANPGG